MVALEVLTIALAVAAVAALATIQALHVRRVKAERRDVLRDVEGLFEDPRVAQDGIGYPTLEGRYAGHDIRLSFVVDTLTMRQLPRLWLMVTVLRRLPVRTPVDILLNPASSDIVSAGLGFRYEHEVPAHWPAHIRVATPEPAQPPFEALDDFLPFLRAPSTKGMLIAPGGVRIVHELARGAIGQYRVTRRPKFSFSLEPERLIYLLDVCIAACGSVGRPSATTDEPVHP